MPNDYEDDDEIDCRARSRELLAEWEAERPAREAEMAERAAQIKRDETLEWARQRAGAREAERLRPLVVTDYAQSKRDADAATKYWHGYIRNQLDQQQRVLLKAIAGAVIGEEKARQQDVAEARSHYRDICARFDDHPTHDEIAALRTTIDKLRERLERLEAAGKATPLRAVG